MRCKKHLTDLSSCVGVCASCLRERLLALIAAQAQAQARAQAQAHQAHEHRRKPEPHPPPLVFPRSVSPYVSRRKSETADWSHLYHHHHSLSDQRFYSTPQIGPTGSIVEAGPYKKKHGRFSLFSNLFRSKSDKLDLDRGVSVGNSGDSCSASSSSPSWFSAILSGHRKKQSRLFSLDESAATGLRRPFHNRDRGMSPARDSGNGEDEECYDGSSGYSPDWPPERKQTPSRAALPVRRGGGRPNHSRSVSGLAFCLSPLVRASPSRHWNQKGMPPELTFPGETRVPVKPHLSTNRSRKLADFGRFNHNH